jgi:formylglycine-generating enzyme required for sulfatase activity
VLHAAAPWAFAKPGDTNAWSGTYDRLDERRAFNDVFRALFVQASYQLFRPGAMLRDIAGRPPEDLWDTEMQRGCALAIFLDDLDRCRPERVLEVLEAINLFLDLPGVCFYLGLDMERLEDLLSKELGAHKAQFLEKIVQISLDLPEVSRSGVEGYVGELLSETRLRALLRRDAGGEGEVGGAHGYDDIAVIAAVMRSRHPRHVKRFLNDLALSLAVLRNTGCLGEAEDKLPERAVVAWHLLRETLEPAKWREVRALTANLGGFLRQWAAAKAAENDDPEGKARRPDGWDEGLQRLSGAGDLDDHIAILNALNPTQRDLLVHTGSPPRDLTAVPDEPAPGPGAGSSLGIDWIPIPEGSFRMGSDEGEENERPVHQVTLVAFEIARDPVTNAQYAAFVRARGVKPPRDWPDGQVPEGKEQHPVVHVSWTEARAFCAWMTELQVAEGTRIALPTEAQWEYAARGSAGRAYPWGGEKPDPERCNFGGNVGGTTPAGSYPKGATPEGVRDLAGNVWEWVEDAWHDDYQGAPADGSAWTQGDGGAERVLRGGSWRRAACFCRSPSRIAHKFDIQYQNLGFRCARVQV